MTGLQIYTAIHVAISLVAIAAGFVVLYGMFTRQPVKRWTSFFLATTILTSVTGFGFPFIKVLPSHIVGGISLLVLAAATFGLYRRRLTGRWRRIYVVSALAALYFNVFVLVVQLFLKTPALNAIAPTQTEPPFVIAQVLVLAAFVVLTVMAMMKFQDDASTT